MAVPDGADRAAIDGLVAVEVVSVLGREEHASGQFFVRASSKARASELVGVYESLGLQVPILHSGLGAAQQRSTIGALGDGTHRGVVMVGMLVEGFDLPSLRVAATSTNTSHSSRQPN